MTDSQKPRLILIDGHALAYRAYFGLQNANFTTSQGEPTHAIYGFLNMILAVWHEYNPDYFIVTFDKGDTFRHEMYKEYKATREKMPDDLRTQIARIEQVVQAFNMPVFTKEGYEADDLLGTLANQAAQQGIEAVIVTGDRDAFQLVAPNIKVLISGRKFNDREVYDEARVETRYGVTPTQLIDLKGLVGDTSDNIPGVKGIGEKGGAKLIQKYGTLEAIYENLDELSKGIRNKLEANRDNAFLSRKLGRIITDVPDITLDVAAGQTMDFDYVEVAKLFVALEFNTIFNRIPGAPKKSPAEVVTQAVGAETVTKLKDQGLKTPNNRATKPNETPTPDAEQKENLEPTRPPDGVYVTVDTEAGLEELVANLKNSERLAVDVETDSLDEVQTNLVGIAITPEAGQGYYIPLRHGVKASGQQASMFEPSTQETTIPQLSLEQVQSRLAPILASPDITKYMHNAKFDITVLARHGLPVKPPIFDTMIATWLANNAPGAKFGLKDLALNELRIKMTPIKALIGSGKKQITMAQVSVEKATPYASADVDMTLRLADSISAQLDDTHRQILLTLEQPLIYVLKDMEMAGIRLDVTVLQAMSSEIGASLNQLIEQIHTLAGHSFNINSTQQLSEVLFTELGLPTDYTKRNKSGYYSTAAGVLERLKDTHEIITHLLAYRQLSKLQSTYVDALPTLINPHTQRVHTNYNQVGVSTGRLSSTNPNLQNIPIRTELGRKIRRAFVPEPGWTLIAADYSQVELRILAHIAEDPGLLQAFEQDQDIHASTAAAVLGKGITDIDKYERRIAKAVNFGLVYGQTAHGLAQGTDMGRKEAQQFINTYFKTYPGVKRYIADTKAVAKQQEYVTTLLGRRREFPNMANLSGPQRGQAEREAINAPIQGTAADIMKRAMIDLHQLLQTKKLQSRLLLQVHDELVLEAPPEEVETVARLTREVMSQAFQLRVPLKVDVELGENWLEMAAFDG